MSLFDTIAEYMNVPYLARRYGGKEPRRLGLAHPSIAPYGVFRARDGDILISVQNEREWQVFCDRVLGESELAADPRFAKNTERVRNRRRPRPADPGRRSAGFRCGISALLDEVRIAYGRVSTMGDLIAPPQRVDRSDRDAGGRRGACWRRR